jgi:hypothetical protein
MVKTSSKKWNYLNSLDCKTRTVLFNQSRIEIIASQMQTFLLRVGSTAASQQYISKKFLNKQYREILVSAVNENYPQDKIEEFKERYLALIRYVQL